MAVGASPASAADRVSIRSVDTREFPLVRVTALFTGERPAIGDVTVRENERVVNDIDVVPLVESQTPIGVVLVIDTSGSMATAGKLDRAKEAARVFVENAPATDSIAIVAFDNEARVAVNFTNDRALLLGVIGGLKPAGETALWDGVRVAAGLFGETSELLPYLVVLSDGADTVSQSTFDHALGAATGVGAGVFPIALTGGGESDVQGLRRLAEATGGQFAETTDARRLGEIYSGVQRVLQNQYEITWQSAAKTPNVDLTVKIGAAIARASIAVNAVGVGDVAQPRVVSAGKAPSALEGTRGLALIAALAGGAAALLGAVGVSAARRERPALEILEAYARGGAPAPETADRDLVPEAVRRAVEATARLTGGGGLLEQLDRKLETADLKLKAQEFVAFYAVGVVAVCAVAAAAAGPLVALAVLLLVALAPIAVVNQLAEARRRAFTRQLPDALQLLSSSLRAGYSLVQGFAAVADEIEDPMGRELRRAVIETRLGRDLEVSLDDTAKRMNSRDFDWVVIAIRIQREVGGNLAELLTSVAETMISRERLRREVSALTAEGRLSAIIVGALPLVVAAALYVLNPGYLAPLFASTIGKAMILGSVVLTCVGLLWMKKVITIDV
ncbi:MAG TPA: type II secretion system F family protein [Acidimicrobiales bacterium]